jgi:hypothetical protein
MANLSALTLYDIQYLRQASRKIGASEVPPGIAKRLLSGGLVAIDPRNTACLTITERGRLALTRLG